MTIGHEPSRSDSSGPPSRVLVVDDEPDVAAVTRLSLKGLRHRGQPVDIAAVASGHPAGRARARR